MTPRLTTITLALGVVLGAACQTDVGPCDERLARRPVWDDFGSPAYEGQAMFQRSCGFGAFCHAPDAPPENRFGVPRGLDWDLRSFGPVSEIDLEALERLRAMHDDALARRTAIWRSVENGRMPIRGAAGAIVAESAPSYFRAAAGGLEPIPEIDSPEGKALFRNWLACDLPLVERSEMPDLVPGYVPVGAVVSEAEVEPLEANWADIYGRFFERRCATSACHGVSGAGELDLRIAEAALEAMVDVPAQGEPCEATGAVMIVPGDADASLLVWKLEGVDADGMPVCGRAMPIGGARPSDASVAAIRAWIDAGAMP